MNRACGAAVARGLERLVDPGTVAGLSERQVVARFVEQRDPVAFEAIVARHGPMVLSVCRQTLRDLAGPIPNQLHHLVKGALSTMFIEKLRTAGLVLAVTTVGVASAATALMAVQEPAKKAAQPAGNLGAQAPNAATKKALGQHAIDRFGGSAGAVFTAPAATAAEEERAAEEAGTIRAKVDLLELENDGLRTRIQRAMAWLDQVGDPLPGERPSFTEEQLRKESRNVEEIRERKTQQIEDWNHRYLKNGVEIARLNYRIAKIPRSLAEAERDDSGKTLHDLLRRIDRLEAKVDRLADSIRTVRP